MGAVRLRVEVGDGTMCTWEHAALAGGVVRTDAVAVPSMAGTCGSRNLARVASMPEALAALTSAVHPDSSVSPGRDAAPWPGQQPRVRAGKGRDDDVPERPRPGRVDRAG